ncbi:MAG TPA: hypothetical protein VIK74_09300 [Parasegetibacter sp.]|jgi:hypothetical protein
MKRLYKPQYLVVAMILVMFGLHYNKSRQEQKKAEIVKVNELAQAK